MPMTPTLDELRAFAVSRSLFKPTTLGRAIEKLGFVQADPIRAPARAQDLTLRHRVKNYRAGDLERRYAKLDIEEDFFINYGFVSRALHERMHPRTPATAWTPAQRATADALLAFIHEQRRVHPRDVDAQFAHGTVTNYWGGTSSATTHLLDAMHYRGLLRVVGRDAGIRLYAAREPSPPRLDRDARQEVDALIDVVVRKYAPLPGPSLSNLVSRLRYGAPQWRSELRAGLARARSRLAHTRIEGIDWYWPADEPPQAASVVDEVRLLAPFDPVVWDRRRFEHLWHWAYRFEAYTPAAKRKLGYYALPLLWRDQMIGWGNLSVHAGELRAEIHFRHKLPRAAGFKRELATELERMATFLDVTVEKARSR